MNKHLVIEGDDGNNIILENVSEEKKGESFLVFFIKINIDPLENQ